MAEYRAYTVGTDDHFIGFREMICLDDDEAVAKATRLVNGHDIEVWNGPRLVIRLTGAPCPDHADEDNVPEMPEGFVPPEGSPTQTSV